MVYHVHIRLRFPELPEYSAKHYSCEQTRLPGSVWWGSNKNWHFALSWLAFVSVSSYSNMCMSSSSEAKPASPSSPANNSSGYVSRDPSWLKLDVCPEYMEQSCLINEEDCPLAHPSSSINIVEGTVTCCFDFIKVVMCEKENVEQFGIFSIRCTV